jgi:X-Pro dipeptidyl-peptidase
MTALVVSPSVASATERSTAEPPHIGDGETVPVYSYADAIREHVWVDSPHDFDRDGRPDRVAVDVIRPREAADAGVRVPVIIDTSPYYYSLGRGNEGERKEFGPDARPAKFPLFYDNYFVPRGYAVALVDDASTGASKGCFDVSGLSEVGSAVAVVDWLNGRATAFNPIDGTPAVATTWSTGTAGMIGKSYDGGLANGAAVTGVPGLATIVPIAGPTDYYELWRPGGAMRVGSIGPAFPEECGPYTEELEARADFVTGNYNEFWGERDYVSHAEQVRASVFVVAGRYDAVVAGSQFARWWEALGQAGVPRRLWLSGVGHVDPFDFRRAEWVRTLHRWFDHWLHGIDNGIMDEPPVSIEQEPDVWVDEQTWPVPGGHRVMVHPVPGIDGAGELRRRAAERGAELTLVDDPTLDEADAIADPTTPRPGRLVFQTAPLTRPVRISGVPTLRLRITADGPTTMVTARLVEYGAGSGYGIGVPGDGITTGTTESCWGASTTADDACYFDTTKAPLTADLNVLGRGWMDAAHRRSLTDPSPLRPGRWSTVRLSMDGQDRVVPAGHRIALVVTLTDPTFQAPASTGVTVTVDLAQSRLMLPIVGRPGWD